MVGENITLNLRSDLYTHLLKMHIGWHDDAKNSGGVLTAILANDIQKLNGMSTEAIATIVRAALGLIGGDDYLPNFRLEAWTDLHSVSAICISWCLFGCKVDKK